MDFPSFARRASAFDLSPLDQDQIRKLMRLFDRGATMVDLATRYRMELGGHPLSTYQRAREVWHEYRAWLEAIQAMSAQRKEREIRLIPNEALDFTWTTAGLAAMQRAAALEDVVTADHVKWHDCLSAWAAAWSAALTTALAEGVIILPTEDGETARIAPLEVEPSAWLTLWHRIDASDDSPEVELPVEAITATVAELLAAYEPSVESIATVVTDALGAAVLDIATRRAVVEGIVHACEAVAGATTDGDGPELVLEGDDARRLEAALTESGTLAAPPAAKKAAPAKETAARPRRGEPWSEAQTGSHERGRDARLNPQVRRLSDLEPGMMLTGKVKNVNRFGAFVDVGLTKEGLIPNHVLADLQTEPDGIPVRAGATVEVQVQSVDAARRRFDLKLEAVIAKGTAPETGGDAGGRGGRRGGRGRGRGR